MSMSPLSDRVKAYMAAEKIRKQKEYQQMKLLNLATLGATIGVIVVIVAVILLKIALFGGIVFLVGYGVYWALGQLGIIGTALLLL